MLLVPVKVPCIQVDCEAPLLRGRMASLTSGTQLTTAPVGIKRL
jgi:hypothetical protein